MFVPLVSFGQLESIYFSGIELVILTDDLNIVPVFQDKIIATSTFLPRYEGDYISVMTKGKIIDSLEAESDTSLFGVKMYKSLKAAKISQKLNTSQCGYYRADGGTNILLGEAILYFSFS